MGRRLGRVADRTSSADTVDAEERETSTSTGLTVAAVARRLGVAPATLRTWDRRYGLGPTGHASGAHRRYSPDDVARLDEMRRQLLAGASTAHAAQAAQTMQPTEKRATASPPTTTARTPGEKSARGLLRAATAMDAAAVRTLTREALDLFGVTAAWHHVLCPALVTVGERWEATAAGVEVEHLLAEAIGAELRAATPVSPADPPVLLACPDGDYHSLPLLALAAVLAEHGVTCRQLGGSVPSEALTAAVTRTGPAVVVLYAQLPLADAADVIAAVPTTRPPATVVVGGPGWLPAEKELASLSRVSVAPGLAEAVTAVLIGLGRGGA